MERNTPILMLRLIALSRPLRRALVVACDLAVCILAVWIAYWLRLGEWELLTPRALIFTALAVGGWVAVALWQRTYRSVTRFAGAPTSVSLARSCAILAAVLAIILVIARFNSVPRTLSVIHPIVFFLGLTAERLLLSHLIVDALQGLRDIPLRKQVLIYGAGVSGQQLAASIRQEPSLYVVGFVDRNEGLRGSMLEGKRIWHTSDLEQVLAEEPVEEVLLALPSARRSQRRAIVEQVQQHRSGVRVRVLPSFSPLASGRI